MKHFVLALAIFLIGPLALLAQQSAPEIPFDSVPNLLQRLCCSRQTFLSMEDKYLEISELTIPQGDVAIHVSEHISDLARLALITRSVAGVSASHIKPYRKSPKWFRPSNNCAQVNSIKLRCTGRCVIRRSSQTTIVAGFSGWRAAANP